MKLLINRLILILFFVFQFFVFQSFMFSQNKIDSIVQNNNSIYFELFGNAGLYSLNYDRLFVKLKFIKINVQFGLSYTYPFGSLNDGFFHNLAYPIGISSSLFHKNHHLEYGLNINPSFLLYKEKINQVYLFSNTLNANFGYRYQKTNSIFLKFYLLYNLIGKTLIENSKLFFGMGIGKNF